MIPAIPSIPPTPATSGIAASAGTDAAALSANTTVADVGGQSFSSTITNAIESLQQTQSSATNAEALSAAGQGNLADTMIAAQKASVDTQVSTALLDKAVDSYNQIMNMSF